MRFLKYWWRIFITWFENLFKKTQKEQDLEAPAPLKEDLDAPVPANKQKKGNPLFQRDASVAMANGCVANERHYVSNNIKNIGGNNMGNFWGPKTPEECQKEIEKHEQKMKEEMAQIKELEKKKLEFQQKKGVKPVIQARQEKILPPNISNITMRSNNDNSNWMDPNDLNNTFEYQNVDKKALNAMGTKIKQDVKQEIKKDMDDKFAESTNNINQLKEDMKEVKKDIKDIKDEQIDLKKMIARNDEQIADNKRRLDNQERMLAEMKQQTADIRKQTEKMEENQKAHDEIMAMLWNKLDEWNGIKTPTREGNDNRESTNTSFSSFKYKNPFRNNTRQPKMEQPDMAHNHDEN